MLAASSDVDPHNFMYADPDPVRTKDNKITIDFKPSFKYQEKKHLQICTKP